MAAKRPEDPQQRALVALSRPLRGRRAWSWFLFLGLIFALALAPLWLTQRAAREQGGSAGGTPPPRTSTPLAWDRVWDAGPLAAAHAALAHDCRACHAEPFVRVRDVDCLVCHQTIAAHVDPAHAPADDAAPRCASCHREHQGPMGLALQIIAHGGGTCVDCHADLGRRRPEYGLLDVADFYEAHPEFALRVADGAGLRKVRRGEAPIEEPTTLRFSHALHLDPAGIDAPSGRRRLDCGDCHQADTDARGFAPVRFESACRDCHAMHLEHNVARRQVPHGRVEETLAMIREFYSYVVAVPGALDPPAAPAPAIGRPGAPSEPRREAVAADLARAAAIDLFERRACAICHQVTRVAEYGAPGSPAADLPDWRIGALPIAHPWMPDARFSHATHQHAACGDCHAAAASEHAAEVLMPSITVCRDCHSGAERRAGLVHSECGLCHVYHPSPVPVPAAASGVRSAAVEYAR